MGNESIIYYEPALDKTIELFKQQNFFNGRFNDGELMGIRTRNSTSGFGENIDQHKYFPKMGTEMRNVLLKYKYVNNYLISSTVTWYESNRDVIDEIFTINPNLRLHSGYFFYDILKKPEFFHDFISFLNQKNVVVVGPSYYNDNKLFKRCAVIEVPLINAYTAIDKINAQIEEFNKVEEGINYVFMCGMMAGIIVDKFYLVDKKNSYYDVGSALDFFFQSSKFDGSFRVRRQNIELRQVLNNHYGDYIV